MVASPQPADLQVVANLDCDLNGSSVRVTTERRNFVIQFADARAFTTVRRTLRQQGSTRRSIRSISSLLTRIGYTAEGCIGERTIFRFADSPSALSWFGLGHLRVYPKQAWLAMRQEDEL